MKINQEGSWALGWRIAHTPKGDVVNHGGDNPGFHCFAVMSVKRKSGLVMMTNGENGGKFLNGLLAGDLLKPFVESDVHYFHAREKA